MKDQKVIKITEIRDATQENSIDLHIYKCLNVIHFSNHDIYITNFIATEQKGNTLIFFSVN